jgi:hypothetical protein
MIPNQQSSNVIITVDLLRKKFKCKANIIAYFNSKGKLELIYLGLFFPNYDCYDFEFLLQVLKKEKKVI